MIDTLAKAAALDAHTRRSISLRVRIYKQNRGLGAGQNSSQIYGRRRFTDAPLLICYRYYSCHRGETSITGGQARKLAQNREELLIICRAEPRFRSEEHTSEL